MVKKVIPRKANPELLESVEICDDPVEYTIRCVLALAPNLSEAIAREAEDHVRNVLGETVQSRRIFHEKRNEAIRRDYRNGERLELLERRYGLGRVQLWRIVNDVPNH